MDEESLEIYITEDGTMMLYPAVLLLQEIAEEIPADRGCGWDRPGFKDGDMPKGRLHPQ